MMRAGNTIKRKSRRPRKITDAGKYYEAEQFELFGSVNWEAQMGRLSDWRNDAHEECRAMGIPLSAVCI